MMRTSTVCRRLEQQSLAEPRVLAAIQGQREAASELLTELLPRVRNLVRYSAHVGAEVEDITQEALVAILRGLPTYRGEGAFAAWADRVVVRVTFAASRRARAERQQVDLDEERASTVTHSDTGQPEDCLLRDRMVRFLDKLSDEQRRALLLHYVMGMSVPEVAEELATPAETIRSRLRLGKAHLRALFFREGALES